MTVNVSTKEDLMQQQILAVAKRLFQVYGLAKVTMDDVAKAIGKGRSSLYYYYKSKDEIFDAVMTIEIREMLAAMADAVDHASGLKKKLHAFFLTKLEILREKRQFFRMLDAGMDADALTDFMKAKIVYHNLIIRQESNLLERVLRDAMEKGELRKITEPELDMNILVILSSLRGLKREIEMAVEPEKIVPMVDTFTSLIIHGL